MPKPVNCRYFYGDYFRGKEVEECRLLAANAKNQRPWRRSLCDSCPVPEVVISSNCRHLLLEAEVGRAWLRDRVQITFAACQKHMQELADAHFCPECAKSDG
jgi:hypothetical protein